MTGKKKTRNNRPKFRLKPKTPEGYLTIQSAADYLNISERSIRRYIKEYGLPAAMPAGRWLIKRTDLDEWIKEHS